MSKNLKTQLLNNAVSTANNAAANAATKVAAKSAGVPQDKKKLFMIIVLIVFGIAAFLGLIGFIMQQKNDGTVKSFDGKINTNTKEIALINEKIESNFSQLASNMKRGDQGPPGIQGPPGPTGGIHAGAGPLLCVGQRKVATPTSGTSNASVIYLDDRRYTPIQYWTLRNNKDNTVSIVNKFTQNCMTYNDNFEIYSDKCDNIENQKFTWGNNMTLSPSSKFTEQCISVQNKFPLSDMNNNKYNLDDNSIEDKPASGEVTKLLLKKCSTNYDANQTWWIGN
jgi:hypothetical protein